MTRLRRLVAIPAILLALTAPAAALATPRSPAEYERLAHEVFAELVGLDTTHAVGSARAAAALAARFRAAGFPAEDVYLGGPRPDKMNIVVRLHGRGKARPVLFNAHLDVVEASKDSWSVDPFVLTEKDGFYYGRGTLDDKNEVAVLTANLLRLKREGFRADRDVIVFFSTDEEAGGDANGVEWMLREHRPLIDAETVVNHDAGKVEALNGERLWNTLQTAEKVYATYTLISGGSGGHSSLPTRDNAIVRLARALTRLDAYQFPVRFSATTRQYLQAVATRLPAERAAAIAALLRDPADAGALDRLRDVPFLNAQVHSTCPVTVVQAGQSESALPTRARATIQCRLLPDERPEVVLATLQRVVDDPLVEVGVVEAPALSPATALEPAFLAKVERVTAEMWPGLKVVPLMSAGASDNVHFRRAGFTAFGVAGTLVDETDSRKHGRDERIGVAAFYESLEFSYRLTKSLAAAR